jgi:hypothetical protein
MQDSPLPRLTNNEASDDLCEITNQAIQDKASLLVFSFHDESMKVEYQISGINYQFAVSEYVNDYEMPRIANALKNELESWLSGATIEGTNYRWQKPSDNLVKQTDRVKVRLDQTKPVVDIELTRIHTLNDIVYLLGFEYEI